MEDIAERLSDRIIRLRLAKGISQAELYRRSGHKHIARRGTPVSDWENCRSKPNPDEYPGLAKALGCSIDYLMTGQEAVKLAILQRAILASPRPDHRLIALVRGQEDIT